MVKSKWIKLICIFSLLNSLYFVLPTVRAADPDIQVKYQFDYNQVQPGQRVDFYLVVKDISVYNIHITNVSTHFDWQPDGEFYERSYDSDTINGYTLSTGYSILEIPFYENAPVNVSTGNHTYFFRIKYTLYTGDNYRNQTNIIGNTTFISEMLDHFKILTWDETKPITSGPIENAPPKSDNKPPFLVPGGQVPDPTEVILVKMNETKTFRISAADPNNKTADLRYTWYIDGLLKTVYGTSTFAWKPGINDEGNHIIKVRVSDGLASVDAIWNVTVKESKTPAEPIIIYQNQTIYDNNTKTIETQDWKLTGFIVTGAVIITAVAELIIIRILNRRRRIP
jgi:hypothetical protein